MMYTTYKAWNCNGDASGPLLCKFIFACIRKVLVTSGQEKTNNLVRYTDAIFTIWPHGEEDLINFIWTINSQHRTIKFTAGWSSKSVTFFIRNVIRDGNRLIADLYTKSTDTHQYIHQHSCHPLHCRNSIAYSQALRIRRICPRHMDYLRHIKEMKGFWSKEGTTKE